MSYLHPPFWHFSASVLTIVKTLATPRFKTLRLTCAALAILTMSACSWPSDPLTVDEQVQALESDLGMMYAQQEALDHPLTLPEAIARGIKYNINHRVAMMEEIIAQGDVNNELLGMLPAIDAEGGYKGRDRENVVSAESDATGAQSLEPSIFQDQHRRTATLNASWNTLDAGMAYIRSREANDKARVALERRRKVVQNIAQDVRYAYWRAASAQLLDSHINDLLGRADSLNKRLADEELKKSNKDSAVLLDLQKNLYETMRDLMTLRRDLATAHTELATLINLPPNADFEIAATEGDMMALNAVPQLTTTLQDLETLALFIRPEMREQMLLKRVAARGARAEVLKSFPAIGGALGYNYDGNSYLKDEEWANFSLGLTQNLMKLFTLPVRLKNEKSKSRLAELQRMAMVASVMTQMNLAHTQYEISKEDYDLMKRLLGVNQRIMDHARGKARNSKTKDIALEGQMLQAEMDYLLTRTGLHMAYANTENAFGKVMTTIGLDPLPPHVEEQSLSDLTKLVEKRYENLDENVIKTLVSTLRTQTNLLNEQQEANMAATPAAASAEDSAAPAPVETPEPVAEKEITKDVVIEKTEVKTETKVETTTSVQAEPAQIEAAPATPASAPAKPAPAVQSAPAAPASKPADKPADPDPAIHEDPS